MDHIDENLKRAALWGFLAEALRPPSENLYRAADHLRETAAALGLEAESVVTALHAAKDIAAAFDDTFGHTVRGPCPAYEAEYGGPKGLRYAHVIGDLQGYYRAFGLQPSRDASERPDHASVECEFFGFLAVKTACAAELHGEEQREVCHEASRDFLQNHLGRFGRALAARMRGRREPFYREVGRLLEQAIVSDGNRLRVEVGATDLGLREDAGAPEDACMNCGLFDGGTPR